MNTQSEQGKHPLKTTLDIIEEAGRLTSSTVIVAGGDREDDIRLVESARDHGFVDRIVLVGRKPRILHTVRELGIDIPEDDIIDAEGAEAIAARTVETALDQDIDILLKGGVTTSVLSRHMLRLANRTTAGLVTMLDAATLSGGRLMFLTDPALTTVCNFGRLSGLIRNAVDVARAVAGIEKPRVALLSAYEGVIPTLPSTRFGRELADLDWPDARVCGPLSFDLATDPKALKIKGLPALPSAEEVAGRADVLVCPNIETGNVLYKCISALARYGLASLANIAVGFDVAYGIISRADAVETRLASIALCGVYAQRTRSRRRRIRPIAASRSAASRTVLILHPSSDSVRAELYRDDRLVQGREVEWRPAASMKSGRVEEETALCANKLAEAVLKGEEGPVEAVGCAGGLAELPASGPKPKAVPLAEKRAGAVIRNRDLESLNLAAAGWAGIVPLGVPLAGSLAEALSAPAVLFDPVEAEPIGRRTGGGSSDPAQAVSAWLVPAVLNRAERDFGLPASSLRLLLVVPAEPSVVVLVEGGRVKDLWWSPRPNRKTGSAGGEGGSLAEPWIEDRLAAAFEAAGNCLHAMIPVGGRGDLQPLIKRLKNRFSLLAPILPFDGRPDPQGLACRLRRMFDLDFQTGTAFEAEEGLCDEDNK